MAEVTQSSEGEQGLTGGVPTTQGASVTSSAPQASSTGQVVSDATVAYISADVQYPYFAVDRALEQTIDQAERRYGIDIYDRMLDEPILAGMERVLKILALADGLTILPSHPRPPRSGATLEQARDFDQAERMAEYIRSVIERMSRLDEPILDWAWNAFDGLRLGHKLSEATYDHMTAGEFKGKLGLESLRCKPRQNYAFVVDPQNRFRGVVAKIPGSVSVVWQGIVFDLSQLSNAIAPEKLFVFAPDKVNGDPRGRSWFRAPYDPWYRKQLLKPEELNAAVVAAGQKVSVELPDVKGAADFIDPVTGLKINIFTAIKNAVRNWKNNGVCILPSGTKLTVHGNSIPPAFFDSMFSRLDREMVTSFLLSSRAILEAKHGSKADSESSQDLLDELKMFLRGKLCEGLRLKLFYQLILMSYGQEMAEKYTPIATMQRASRPDFAANATAVAALQTSGYLDDSQKPQIDSEILDLPERELPEASDDDAPDGEEGADANASAGFQRRRVPADTDGRKLAAVDAGRASRAARVKPRS